MHYLSQFLPAQALILIDRGCSVRELLKVTFMDLLFKRVLQTISVESQPHPLTRVHTSTYVMQGGNYAAYNPKPHEGVFTSPFFGRGELEILFRHLVKIGYERSGGRIQYKGMLIDELAHKGLVERKFWHYLFGGCSLTPKGEEISKALQQEIQALSIKLPQLIENEPEKALDILSAIKGNVFLLKGFDLELLKKFDQELVSQMRNTSYTDDSSDVSSGIGYWYLFEECSDSFDNSCCHDFGCGGGGDSGCSGGGCSGCGGCGGD